MLIPAYLAQIKNFIRNNKVLFDKKNVKGDLDNDSFPSITTNAAVSTLGSLIVLTDHYEDYPFPSMPNFYMAELKKQTYELIIFILEEYITTKSKEKDYLKVINKALCCATVIVYQETIKANPNKETIKVFSLRFNE